MRKAFSTGSALPLRKRGAGPITFHDDLASAVAGAELVIENVPENLQVKAEVYRALDALLPADTIVASDTSGLPITKLQAFMSNPARVVGMHWSNPPHIIPMIEVIAGEKTAPQTVDFIVRTIRALNLLPVVVKKDVPGFVENRVLYALLREAVSLVESGVIDPEDLDTCVSWGIGYKLGIVGPMALLDMAGLDIYESVSELPERRPFHPRRRGALRARAHGRGPARHQDREGRVQLHARTRRGAAGGARRPLRRRPQGAGGARMTLLRGPVRRRPHRQASRSSFSAQASFIGAGASPARRVSGTGLRVSQLRPASPHQSAVTGIRSSTALRIEISPVLGSNHRVASTVSPCPASPRSSEYQWAIDALQAMRPGPSFVAAKGTATTPAVPRAIGRVSSAEAAPRTAASMAKIRSVRMRRHLMSCGGNSSGWSVLKGETERSL